jgi:excisionase family DNA binding protein
MNSHFTVKSLAEHWGVSAKHMRKLIKNGDLKAFRCGLKILLIPKEAVEDYQCQHLIRSVDTEESLPSSSMPTASDDDLRSELLTGARLSVLRQRSMRN